MLPQLEQFPWACWIQNSLADSSLFIRKFSTSLIIALVYVNDFVIMGGNLSDVCQFIDQVCQEFQCCYLGDLAYFFGIEAHWHDGYLFVSQRKYSLEIWTCR